MSRDTTIFSWWAFCPTSAYIIERWITAQERGGNRLEWYRKLLWRHLGRSEREFSYATPAIIDVNFTDVNMAVRGTMQLDGEVILWANNTLWLQPMMDPTAS